METIRLPFEIVGLYSGCAKIDGILIVSSENLILEYRMRDALIGMWSGDIATWKVAWTDIDSAEGGYGFFAPWLLLSARTMTAFDSLPTVAPGQLRLRIRWKHRRRLKAAVSEINLLLSYREADRYREQLPGGSR